MKTIRELAEELDVSKTTIRNHLKNLPDNLSVTKRNNMWQLDTDVEAFVKDKVQKVSDNYSQKGLQEEHILNEKLEMLKERNNEIVSDNKYLREQLKEKNNQIEKLSKLLDQQQQLQLRSTQELDRIKQEKVELIETQEQQEEQKGFFARLLGK